MYRVAPSPTLNCVQYLRAIAAMMVAYHHARDRLPGLYDLLPNPVGEAGVDLFFVISGFIMVITTAGRGTRPADFMLRRIARIVPSHWFYTTALALFIIAMPGILNLSVTLPHYLESIFFLPHIGPEAADTFDRSLEPLLQPGWTLNFEMFFYCLFAVSLIVPPPYRTLFMVSTIIGLVGLGQTIEPVSPALVTYTSPLLLEFAYGVVIGFLFVSGILVGKIRRDVAWSMIVAGGAIALCAATFVLPRPFEDFYTSFPRAVTYGTAAVLVVVGALALESSTTRRNRRNPLLAFLRLATDASYALYLTHLFSIAILRIIWIKLDLGSEGMEWGLAFVSASVVFALAIAILSYLVLERPVTHTLQRMLKYQARNVGVGASPI